MKEIFTDRLKSARGCYSQQAIADKIGIKQQAYARYEAGRSTPGIEVLGKMCAVFGVSADWLLGLSDDRAPSSGVSITATHSAVAINGHSNTVHADCQHCPLMQAAAKVTKGTSK